MSKTKAENILYNRRKDSRKFLLLSEDTGIQQTDKTELRTLTNDRLSTVELISRDYFFREKKNLKIAERKEIEMQDEDK